MDKEDLHKKKLAEKNKAYLLGLGLDGEDDQVRITRGENFHLIGGSKDTHEQMQERAIKFNEKLKKKGKRLEEISREEFLDIAHEVGMKVLPEDFTRPKEQK